MYAYKNGGHRKCVKPPALLCVTDGLCADDHLIPRIRECLEGAPVPQRSDAPTGRELLRLYATDYFTKMSEVRKFILSNLCLVVPTCPVHPHMHMNAFEPGKLLSSPSFDCRRARKRESNPHDARCGWMKKWSISLRARLFLPSHASACRSAPTCLSIRMEALRVRKPSPICLSKDHDHFLCRNLDETSAALESLRR